MIKRVAVGGLRPALIVTVVLAAAFIVPGLATVPLAIVACYPVVAPTVTSVAPTSGTTLGGTSVVITGTCFGGTAGVAGVKFGASNAASYTVDSATQITAISPAHPAGAIDITVTNGALTSATSSADRFTFLVACSSVSMTAAPPSGQPSGTQVVFTATSVCPNAGQKYEFWLRTASTDWQLIQGYSTLATYNWDSTGAPTGVVTFGVWVKDASSTTSTFDANFSMPYTINPPCPNPVSVSAAPPSVSEGSGTHSTLTGVATGCANSPLYEYWLRTATTDWILVRGYTASPTYDWNSTGAPKGLVYFGLWVKDTKSTTTTFDQNANTTVNVTPAVCTALTVTRVPVTVVHSSSGGMHVTVTGAATGCTNSPLYEFWLRTATSDWILVQSYTALATYDWNSTGAPVGTIYFGVWAKDTKSSTSTFDVNGNTTVAVT